MEIILGLGFRCLLLALVVTLLWAFTRKQPELDAVLLTNENGDFSRIMKRGYDTVCESIGTDVQAYS